MKKLQEIKELCDKLGVPRYSSRGYNRVVSGCHEPHPIDDMYCDNDVIFTYKDSVYLITCAELLNRGELYYPAAKVSAAVDEQFDEIVRLVEVISRLQQSDLLLSRLEIRNVT